MFSKLLITLGFREDPKMNNFESEITTHERMIQKFVEEIRAGTEELQKKLEARNHELRS